MENKKYKDQCDECKAFNYCKGVNGKVLCPECAKKEEQNNGNQSKETKQ